MDDLQRTENCTATLMRSGCGCTTRTRKRMRICVASSQLRCDAGGICATHGREMSEWVHSNGFTLNMEKILLHRGLLHRGADVHFVPYSSLKALNTRTWSIARGRDLEAGPEWWTVAIFSPVRFLPNPTPVVTQFLKLWKPTLEGLFAASNRPFALAQTTAQSTPTRSGICDLQQEVPSQSAHANPTQAWKTTPP